MQRVRVGVAIALVLAAMHPSVNADIGASRLDGPLTFDLAGNSFVAIRFNLTGSSNLWVTAELRQCRGAEHEETPLLGNAGFVTADGSVPKPAGIGLRWYSWIPGSESARGTVGGTPFTTGTDESVHLTCNRHWFYASAKAREAERSLTLIVFTFAPHATLNVTYEHNDTVSTVDGHQGPAIGLTKGDFPGIGSTGVASVAGSAGVLGRVDVSTSGNAVGWFAPRIQESLVVAWDCRKNGDSCGAPTSSGVIPLASSAPTDWSFRLDAHASPGELPYYALGFAEIGGGYF